VSSRFGESPVRGLVSGDVVDIRHSAHFGPMKRLIERLAIRPRQSLPPFRGLRVDRQREPRIGVPDRFRDVDRVVAECSAQRCVRASQRVRANAVADRLDPSRVELSICPANRRLQPPGRCCPSSAVSGVRSASGRRTRGQTAGSPGCATSTRPARQSDRPAGQRDGRRRRRSSRRAPSRFPSAG
jgi:hypothetical protein